MVQQNTSSPPEAGTVNNMIMSRKRKRKRHFHQTNDAATSPATLSSSAVPSAVTSEAAVKEGDGNSSSQPKKKRKRRNKKKSEEGSKEGIKPVLIVKKPEDYSANWKMLKEIITKDDKKPGNKKPFIRRRNKDNKTGRKPQVNASEECPDDKQDTQEEEEETLDIWFDNVDPILLEETQVKKEKQEKQTDSLKSIVKPAGNTLVEEESPDGSTKVVAMDCEMVGVGMNGKDSILARVSLVNHFGKVLYDKYVKPTEEVVDYRTPVSGIRPANLVDGCEFSVVQKEVSELLEGRILVGHSLRNDLRSLFLSHPRSHIRDTSKYKVFTRQFGGRTPSLKRLAERLLGVQIQQGEHSSVQDAQAAMRLYTMHRKEWEKSRRNKYKLNAKRSNAASAKREQQASQDAEGEAV